MQLRPGIWLVCHILQCPVALGVKGKKRLTRFVFHLWGVREVLEGGGGRHLILRLGVSCCPRAVEDVEHPSYTFVTFLLFFYNSLLNGIEMPCDELVEKQSNWI